MTQPITLLAGTTQINFNVGAIPGAFVVMPPVGQGQSAFSLHIARQLERTDRFQQRAPALSVAICLAFGADHSL